MACVLEDVFTPYVIERLQRYPSPSPALTRRIEILTSVERPDSDWGTRTWNLGLCTRRAAWNDYVSAMHKAGLFDDDVRARLRGRDDDGFRSALSECLTCHFLTRVLHLDVFGRHEGRSGTALDFGIRHGSGDVSVEVKSPYTEKPEGSGWMGDRSHILGPVLDLANKQFAEGRRNVLALVPLVQFPMLNGRRPFVKAFFGEPKTVIMFDTTTGETICEPETRFITEGKLLKLWPEPRFTRTGAVLVIREELAQPDLFQEDFEPRLELRWFVLHNPHSSNPVPDDLWGPCPQLVRDGDVIRWTDGGSIDGSSGGGGP